MILNFKSYITESTDDYTTREVEIIDNLNLNFDFLSKGINYSYFYQYVNSFLKEDIDGKSAVYLTLCSLAILFDEDKTKYKMMFEELRLRGIYGSLKPIVNVLKSVETDLFDLANLSDNDVNDFESMFNYTDLFKPFLNTLGNIISNFEGTIPEDNNLFNQVLIILNDDNLISDSKLSNHIKELIDSIESEGGDIKKFTQYKDDVEIIMDDINVNI